MKLLLFLSIVCASFSESESLCDWNKHSHFHYVEKNLLGEGRRDIEAGVRSLKSRFQILGILWDAKPKTSSILDYKFMKLAAVWAVSHPRYWIGALYGLQGQCLFQPINMQDKKANFSRVCFWCLMSMIIMKQNFGQSSRPECHLWSSWNVLVKKAEGVVSICWNIWSW